MTAKQDRQGVRTASELEQKYKFGTQFAEIMGIATDARDSVEKVESVVYGEVTDQISSLTRDASSITAKVEETSKNVDGLNTRTSTLEVTASGLSASISTVQTGLSEKANKEDVDEITEHFLFKEDGLTIFNTATGMGINVSEKQVAFTGGTDPTTVITPNDMKTTNIKVNTRLDLGNFSFLPRTNGNLSFRYTGG